MTVLLDPWSLVWPRAMLDEQRAEEYVERLTSLFDLAFCDPVMVAVSDESIEMLMADNSYPLVEAVPEVLWPSRADIYRLVSSLLQKLPSISQVGVSAILIDAPVSEPEIDFCLSRRHKDHLDELYGTSLVVEERLQVDAPPILSAHVASNGSYRYAVKVVDIECKCNPSARLGDYQGVVNARSSLSDCIADWSSTDLFLKGFVEQAIALEVWKSTGRRGVNPFSVDNWRLGRNFTGSIGGSGVAQLRAKVDALIRTCVDVVVGRDSRSTHFLRTSSSGGAPQVVRSSDGGRAWRADIDYEFHLHYWICGDTVELADVVPHNTFDISH